MAFSFGKRSTFLYLNRRICFAIVIACALFSMWYFWLAPPSTSISLKDKANSADIQKHLPGNNGDTAGKDGIFDKDIGNTKRPLTLLDGREAALQLMGIHRKLEEAFFKQTPPRYSDVVALRRLAAKLYPPINITAHSINPLHRELQKSPDNSKVNQSPVNVVASVNKMVCPEVYEGIQSGFLWRTLNCTVTTPLSEVLSIVINACEFTEDSAEVLKQLLLDFNSSYPGVKVIVACGKNSQTVTQLANSLNKEGSKPLVALLKPVNQSVGRSDWSAAFDLVKTPLTLVARDMRKYLMSDSPLERLVRVLTETPGVGVVGGSTRNSSGHWSVGCFQTKLQNYVLRYRKGYHHSHSECMFCDYIDGPFLAYSHLLRETPVSPFPAVAFQEFFLKMSADYLTMACPDVMFSAYSAVLRRNTWLPLVAKLELNRVQIDYERSHVLHRFTCSEAGIDCLKKMDETYSYAMPVCCREELSGALRFWHDFCRRNGLHYQVVAGTLLGAVKMADMLPWDFNANIHYENANFTFLKSSASEFNDHGFPLNDFNDPNCCDKTGSAVETTYMKMWAPNILILLSGWLAIPANESDTLVEVHGVWVRGTHNPGQYVRIRYGHEVLKHAAHWQDAGMESSLADYEPGSFDSCLDPTHHACLDRLSTDGSLAFQIPEW